MPVTTVTYRQASIEEAELASDVMTRAYPVLPQSPEIIRYRWRNPRRDYSYGRFFAERDGKPIAYLGWIHGPWAKVPDRHCEVEVWLEKESLGADLLTDMWGWIGVRAEAEEAALLLAYCAEDEPEMLESLARAGFRPERVEKVWELDLAKHGTRIVDDATSARTRMEGEGITLQTVADWAAPDKLNRLHELNQVTAQDVPTSVPVLDEPFEDFERRANAPDRRQDRWWVARDGDRPVAMSYLKFPPVRGTVWTGYTCTDPGYRGRGIGRAVKLQSLAQAVEIGVPVVCTDNDAENAPMLHINETLGYVHRPGFIEHHKRVTKT